MALQKNTVSINLGNGLDQKSDDKIGPDQAFSYVRDWVYTKIGRINKRFGTNKLSNDSYYPLANPLGIGDTPIPNNVIGFKDQLLLQNKGVLYSQYGNDDRWYFKGHHYPVTLDKAVIHSSQAISSNPDSASVSGITAYSYVENGIPKLTVVEEETGNYIIDNYSLDTTVATQTKILVFSDRMFVMWQTGANLKIANVPFFAGTPVVTSTLKTDAVIAAPVIHAGLLRILNFDAVFVDDPTVGERNFVAYYAGSNAITVFSVTNAGIIDAGMAQGVHNLSNVIRGFSLYHNAAQNTLFVAYSYIQTANLNLNRFHFDTFTFTASAITFGAQHAIQNGLFQQVNSVCFAYSPTNPAITEVFYDLYAVQNFGGEVGENVIYRAEIDNTGTLSAANPVMQGMALAANPINDDVRGTIYLPAVTVTTTQSTCFILDIYRGRSATQPNVLMKFNYGLANGTGMFSLPKFTNLEDAKFFYAVTLKTSFVNSGAIAGQASGVILGQLFNTGIAKAIIDFEPKYAASNVTINNAVYMSGGYIGYYDGSDVYEHGFFINPEPVAVSLSTNGVRAIVPAIIQQGTAGLPEITSFAFSSAKMMETIGSTGPGSYFTFVTPTTTYNVWYRINGVGTAPGVAGTAIQVDLNGDETNVQVQQKTRISILSASNQVSILESSSAIFTLTNNANGVVADATVTGMLNAITSSIPVGNYQYSVIYYYVDVNGQVMRSAPSIATTINIASANTTASIVAWAPPITNKNIVQVFAQLYRTTSNGTVLHRVASFSYDENFSQTSQQVSFIDTFPDASIQSGEVLYTTGGVLPNISIGATKHLSIFKNRIIATDEDKNSFFYSKTSIQGVPVEFSEELSVDLIDDSDPIDGHIQLDDKLIVGKTTKLYYVAGDGANDLGLNSSFTLPTLISTDTGVDNHNSMVQYPHGVMFKSLKGIYLLDRSLQVSYIGNPVEDFNDFATSKAVLLETDNQIRFELQDTTTCLMYDYLFNKWQVFSQYNGTDATMWGQRYARVDYDGFVYIENKNLFVDSGSPIETYMQTFATKWLQIKNVQDYQRVYRLIILGDLKSPHTLDFKVYYDYDETWFDTYSFDSSNINGSELADSVYEPMIHLAQQKCDAIKIEITVTPNGGTEECLQLVDMSFLVGVKQGLMKVRAEKRL